ncbi:hypothetical protein ACO22_03644 [Paracoccidioides brasiliensis]|uniref:Zn(2)-C6 fungal-type domain-containing protein n=1 Tax=Paracoccidioides brasiliensis TaxID=121759 RepID=A0A1D2JFD7_PARBR|nr:hypothetical protein ACO22_03644 [Paracoccidioides brasiliensis]
MDDGHASKPQVTPPTSESGKSKCRAKQSCIPCRCRKVKCDRIKPCHACCVRGLPSECEYVTNNEDRFLITQADAVASLRREVGRLKQQLLALGHAPSSELDAADRGLTTTTSPLKKGSGQPSSAPESPPCNRVPYEEYATLLTIVQTIATASPDVVANTVAQIRTGTWLNSTALTTTSEPQPYNQPGESKTTSQTYTHFNSQSRVQIDEEEQRQPKKPKPGLKHEPADTASADELDSKSGPEPDGLDITHPPDDDKTAITRKVSQGSENPAREQYISRKRCRDSSVFMTPVSQRNLVIENFLGRFVDDFSPNVDCETIGTSQTIRSAAGMRMFSPVLSEAFKAVALTYFGHNFADERIERTGSQIHVFVLRKLQEDINHIEQANSQAILLTVCLLMCFESFRRTTSESLVHHANGALKLLEYRGPQSHMFGIDHSCFAELRPYWVFLALVTRRPTFLAREDWKSVPFLAGSSSKDLMHHLLDQVVDIPAYLAQFDRLIEGLNSGCINYTEVATTQGMLWSWVADLDNRLRQWKKDWIDSVPSRQATEVISQGSDPFPIFRCRDLTTMDIITPTTLIYPDLRIAQTMSVYYASHLILSASDTRSTPSLQPSQQYEFACNICRSMEYFIRKSPGKLINRMAFPLRVAFDVLPESGVEREYVVKIFRLVNDRHKLKLWGTTIPEISSKRRDV